MSGIKAYELVKLLQEAKEPLSDKELLNLKFLVRDLISYLIPVWVNVSPGDVIFYDRFNLPEVNIGFYYYKTKNKLEMKFSKKLSWKNRIASLKIFTSLLDGNQVSISILFNGRSSFFNKNINITESIPVSRSILKKEGISTSWMFEFSGVKEIKEVITQMFKQVRML